MPCDCCRHLEEVTARLERLVQAEGQALAGARRGPKSRTGIDDQALTLSEAAADRTRDQRAIMAARTMKCDRCGGKLYREVDPLELACMACGEHFYVPKATA